MSRSEQMLAVQARRDGASIHQISKTLKRNRETIRQHLRLFGLDGRRTKSTPYTSGIDRLPACLQEAMEAKR